MNCLIVHLSDLHIQSPSPKECSEERGRLIARSAARTGPYQSVFLVLSGDIAYGGHANEYLHAERFISSVIDELQQHAGCEVKLIVAPGNHDCDFTSPSKLRTYARTQRTAETIADPEMLEKLAEPMVNYRRFEGMVETLSFPERTLLHKSATLTVGPMRLQIRVWNSPLYSEKYEKKGELFLPATLFSDGWDQDAFRVAIMHHPAAWFAEPDARLIRTSLRTHAHLVLYGHEHFPEIGEITSFSGGRANEAIEADGPVLHSHGDQGASNFIAYELNLISGAVLATLHSWEGSLFRTSALTDLSRDDGWLHLPRKPKSFEVGDAFLDKIDDPGMNVLSRAGRRVLASDLYVGCDLTERRSTSSAVEDVLSSEILARPTEICGGVVLQGEEKAGKTALLYSLFRTYRHAGFVPVYLPLREHKIKRSAEIAKIASGAMNRIYPDESPDTFAAIRKDRRVFLVDDVDVLVAPSLRTALVEYLQSQSDHFVLTTTLKTQLTEVLTDDSGGAIGQMRSLRFQKFGVNKRGQLIARWLRRVEEVEDEEEFVRRLDTLEKSASVTLGHNLVPRVPQMLLIFLYSTTATSAAKLESGALASYYTFLVTRQLLDAGVVPDEIDEYISFARIVSFFMHVHEKSYVTLAELEICNKKFADEFYDGPMRGRLNVLRNARLLTDFGDGAFQWRHGYLHYLFLGGFLSANADDPDVVEAIKKMCGSLYVAPNANALLFLVHFSKDRKVFGYLRQVIDKVFAEASPLKLGSDTRAFAEVIRRAHELTVPKDVLAEREAHRKAQDEADSRSKPVVADSPKVDVPRPLEDLIVLFKTSEILGQVLKEQYASISRTLREPIVVALLNAFMASKLAAEGEPLSEPQRVELAQSLIADVVQMLMFAFFQKLSENLSSDRTLDLIRNVPWDRSLEVEVFLLACELNLQRPLPLARIDGLLRSANGDPAFVALLRNLVQVRISLFHTRAPELQALAERFRLDLSRLTAVNFRESDR
jgi:hypothetical protein